MEPKPIDKYWSSFFGLTPDEMEVSDVRVVSHHGLQGYNGIWVFRRKSLTIVSVPDELHQEVDGKLKTCQGDVLSESWIRTAFGSRVELVIGPAYHGYVNSSLFHPAPTLEARRLHVQDAEALSELFKSCDGVEWEHSGLAIENLDAIGAAPIFGCFVKDELVAASQYFVQDTQLRVATGGIITHPNYRGRGFGKAVRSASTEDCLKHNYTMLYQTLLSNTPSVAVAKSLGFEQYAVHLAARLS